MAKLLILKGLHDGLYVIDAIAERWADAGTQIIVHYGYENLPEADVVILHVDLTRVPRQYAEQLRAYPVVLNRHVLDISKSSFSKLLVSPNDAYNGPVIVKTDNNFGGKPESRMRRRSRVPCGPQAHSVKNGRNWEQTKWLDPHAYPVFSEKSQVPPGVWKNPSLVVQQFLPEKIDNIYYTRYWMFLGDSGWAARYGAEKPVVKFEGKITPEEPVQIPDELVSLRRTLGLDYGRLDYVIHNNEVVLFDINKTVGGYASCASYAKELDLLAKGIDGYLR